MILQALADYYEMLLAERPGDIARPGWCSRQVAFKLELTPQGELVNIVPGEDKRGWTRMVPEQVKRTVGIAANLLCDNASYLLGIDAKDKPDRAKRCFEAARERHLAFLEGVDAPVARAVRAFFMNWNPDEALEHPAVRLAGDALLAGGNLVFVIDGREALADEVVRRACDESYGGEDADAVVMTCLVSGEKGPIARLHPSIKGVVGAQSMGASLVGFNARAFESYGHDEEQGLNAPVGERAVFAYTTALNYLLSNRNHHTRLGDTTVVYWADRDDEACSNLFSQAFNPMPLVGKPGEQTSTEDQEAKLDRVMGAVAKGHPVDDASLDATFFVLGLAPNAARLSVRFFHRDSFGDVLKSIGRHYERLEIAKPPYEMKYLSPYRLLKETENPNAKQPAATSLLAGSLLRSILNDSPYPAGLYANALLRVRASRDVTRGQAAIVKAYLMNNRSESEEVPTVYLNTERADAPYLLGRMFSRLEDLQHAANPELNATIKDKYFDAAGTTPGLVFPTLLHLAEKHASKLRRLGKSGAVAAFDRDVRDFSRRLPTYPKSLSVYEQGDFLLGYYHQSQFDIERRAAAKAEREKAESSRESENKEA